MANPDPHPTPASNTSELSARLEGKDPDPVIYEGDIDQRMAALLADHIGMGARPADDVTVAEARSDPAKRASAKEAKTTDGRNVMPASTTRAKASRKPRAKKSK